jgi:hypothetical protein
MEEFRVNKLITLRLIDGKTIIFINGQLFQQCKFLLLNIPINKISSLDEIESIDEAVEGLDKSLEPIHENIKTIPPESEFWGHCSNLQVWYENRYNTRLLHSNLAFPLLKKLIDAGDPLARYVFREEIAKRIESGFPSVIQYLVLEGYLDYLNDDELDYIIRSPELINGLVNCCYKNGEGENQFEGLHYLMKKLKTTNIQYFKELLKILLNRNDNRINNFLDRTGLMRSNKITTQELAYLLLEKNEAKTILKLGELMHEELSFSVNLKRGARVRVKDKHIIELSLDYVDLKFIPNNVTKLEKIEYLYLTGNKISEIPSFISKLKYLTYLILEKNNISKIPIEICNLKKLRVLNLSENNINTIPIEICSLKNLNVLNLSQNKIIEIPQCINKLESLEYFIIRDNNLETLPGTILNMRSLKELDCRQNPRIKISESIRKKKGLDLRF